MYGQKDSYLLRLSPHFHTGGSQRSAPPGAGAPPTMTRRGRWVRQPFWSALLVTALLAWASPLSAQACTVDDDCDDGVACTMDQCDNGTCRNILSDAWCDDTLFCNGVEYCDAGSGCQDGLDPCPGDTCVELSATCDCDYDEECTDGLYCTGIETCDAGVCAPGVPVDCDDSIACTIDSCDETNDICVNDPSDPYCDNGLWCDGAETCLAGPGGGCQPGTPRDCFDEVDCTDDYCDEDNDVCVVNPLDERCDDGIYCNGRDFCATLLGCSVETVDCNDGIDCTVDSCDEENDECVHASSNALCDDGFSCTTDVCDPGIGCVHTPNDALCDNLAWCDGEETCDPDAPGADEDGCVAGLDRECGDGIYCTVDTCDEENDECVHTPVDALCDDTVDCTIDTCTLDGCVIAPNDEFCNDGQYCNGEETCDAVSDCQPGTPPTPPLDEWNCTVAVCNEVTDCFDHVPSDELCDDGVYCNGDEACDPGSPDADPDGCVAGPDRDCADPIDCTNDVCNELLRVCLHYPDSTLCDNGEYCDGAEMCQPGVGCVDGPPPFCEDPFPCTTDSCNEVKDRCDHIPDGPCDDGHDCTTDTCTAVDGCVFDPDPSLCDDGAPCTDDDCVVELGCTFTPNDVSCDNEVFCDGVEVCDPDDPGADPDGCADGPDPGCDDGIYCTVDSCDPVEDQCIHPPDDGRCDDELYCSGVELCSDLLGCMDYAPVDCDDGIACTIDSCDEANDECVNASSNALCDDGLPCTDDICDPVEGCLHVSTCDDEIDCTIDTCTAEGCENEPDHSACDDPAACTMNQCSIPHGGCRFIPVDGFCDDELFCSGEEVCDPDDPGADSEGCVEGEDPCPDQNCDEVSDSCYGCLDDTGCDPSQVCCLGLCRNCCTDADCPGAQQCCLPFYTCMLDCLPKQEELE